MEGMVIMDAETDELGAAVVAVAEEGPARLLFLEDGNAGCCAYWWRWCECRGAGNAGCDDSGGKGEEKDEEAGG